LRPQSLDGLENGSFGDVLYDFNFSDCARENEMYDTIGGFLVGPKQAHDSVGGRVEFRQTA
jgi:hypothetical protein